MGRFWAGPYKPGNPQAGEVRFEAGNGAVLMSPLVCAHEWVEAEIVPWSAPVLYDVELIGHHPKGLMGGGNARQRRKYRRWLDRGGRVTVRGVSWAVVYDQPWDFVLSGRVRPAEGPGR